MSISPGPSDANFARRLRSVAPTFSPCPRPAHNRGATAVNLECPLALKCAENKGICPASGLPPGSNQGFKP
jgi:hypothetical protein